LNFSKINQKIILLKKFKRLLHENRPIVIKNALLLAVLNQKLSGSDGVQSRIGHGTCGFSDWKNDSHPHE
jgi:hypothetical protein